MGEQSERGTLACAACGDPLGPEDYNERGDPHWGEGEFWHKPLHVRCCSNCAARERFAAERAAQAARSTDPEVIGEPREDGG